MRALDLLRSTTFRIALIYLALFAASAFALLLFVYWNTSGYMAAQTDETIAAEAQGLADLYAQRGLNGLKIAIALRSGRPQAGIYMLADPSGAPLAGNLTAWPGRMATTPGAIDFVYQRQTPEEIEERPARGRVFALPGGVRLLVGRDIAERVQIEARIRSALAWAAALVLALGLGGGLVLSRNVLRRLDAINQTSADIVHGDLMRRVPVNGSGDEFDALAANLNAMLDQIARLMAGMREVADNIAHDLRTPLNRLRNRLELALMAEPAQHRGALEDTIAEADALISTFNALLLIAQTEAGAIREAEEDVDLDRLVRDAAELYEPVAEARGLTLTADARTGATVRGHRGLLAQALANLLDNAVKYAPDGGRTSVSAHLLPGGFAELRVADTGPGIPAADRERVLQRFVRLEASRNTSGSGLGLSLVAAVARLHGAELTLADGAPGLIVALRFSPSLVRRGPLLTDERQQREPARQEYEHH